MAEFLLKFVTVWLSLDIVILATAWYLTTSIQPLCPEWWRRMVVDDEP